MPGKVNPVIPEAVAMVAAQIMGNHTAITVGAQSGNFQLNVMLPVIGYNLLQSIEILATASTVLADKAIAGTITAINPQVEADTRNIRLQATLQGLLLALAGELAADHLAGLGVGVLVEPGLPEHAQGEEGDRYVRGARQRLRERLGQPPRAEVLGEGMDVQR